MKRCLNCLEYIDNDVQICPHCGAKNDSGEGYILLSEQQAPEREYKDVSSGRRAKPATVVTIIVLILLLVGMGAHYYFNNISNPVNPTVHFSTGTGVINDDKRVIYVAIKDASLIEYIQGVTLYDGDMSDGVTKNARILSTDYSYSDNVDDSFRTIFFYADDLGVKADAAYTYTFKINFSFVKDSNVYSYLVVNSFDGDITDDASDVIFDHSLKKEETTLSYDVTTVNHSDTSYIYDGYWYTDPVKGDDGIYSITAIRFASDSDRCTFTHYSTSDLKGDWQVTTADGAYSIQNGILTYSDSDTKYVVNSDDKTLIEDKRGTKKSELSHTTFNNISNANSFFN